MIKTYDFPNLYHNIVGDIITVKSKSKTNSINGVEEKVHFLNFDRQSPQIEKQYRNNNKKFNTISVKSKPKEIVRRIKNYKTNIQQNLTLKQQKSLIQPQTQKKILFKNYLKKNGKNMAFNIRQSNNETSAKAILQDSRQKQFSIKESNSSDHIYQLSQAKMNQIQDILMNIGDILPNSNRQNNKKRKNQSSLINFYRRSQVDKQNKSKVIKSNFKIKSKPNIGSQKSQAFQNDNEIFAQKSQMNKIEFKRSITNKKKTVLFTQQNDQSQKLHKQDKNQILISRKSNKKLKKSTKYKYSKAKIQINKDEQKSTSSHWTSKSIISLKFDKQSLINEKKSPQYHKEFKETQQDISRQIKLSQKKNKYNTKTKKYIPSNQFDNIFFVSAREITSNTHIKMNTAKKKKLFRKKTQYQTISIKSKTSIKQSNYYKRKDKKKVTFYRQNNNENSLGLATKDLIEDQDEILEQFGNTYYKKNITLRKMKTSDKMLQNAIKFNVFDELNYFNSLINEDYSNDSFQQNTKLMIKPMIINNQTIKKEVVDYNKMKKQIMLFDMSKAINKNLFSLIQKKI